jgi:hypothetical protein
MNEKPHSDTVSTSVNDEATSERMRNLRFEYEMAQQMLCHYDRLNWTIGSILIAGVIAMTGLVVNNDIIAMMSNHRWASMAVVIFIPLISFYLLTIWTIWFYNHKEFYDARNEVFHRIEPQLKMYHYLQVVERLPSTKNIPYRAEYCERSRRKAGYVDGATPPFEQQTVCSQQSFFPIYSWRSQHKRIAGHALTLWLSRGIPVLQFAMLFIIWIISNWNWLV